LLISQRELLLTHQNKGYQEIYHMYKTKQTPFRGTKAYARLGNRITAQRKPGGRPSHFQWIFDELSTNHKYYTDNPKELFKFWLLGLSLRQLEHYLSRNICKSSLSCLFIREFGADYASAMRFNIFTSVLREGNTRRDEESIVEWCKKLTLNNMLKVIQDDTMKYRSTGQLKAIETRKQISYSEEIQYRGYEDY